MYTITKKKIGKKSGWVEKWNDKCMWIDNYYYGSGVCSGVELWRTYCVHWKTLKAKLAKKSLADRRPATGRNWNPVRSLSRKQQQQKLLINLII